LRADPEIHCFRLTLPLEELLRRIERRASARALDESDFERNTVLEEYALLSAAEGSELGEPIDAFGAPDKLAESMLNRFLC
jgi:hypothetical protein